MGSQQGESGVEAKIILSMIQVLCIHLKGHFIYFCALFQYYPVGSVDLP